MHNETEELINNNNNPFLFQLKNNCEYYGHPVTNYNGVLKRRINIVNNKLDCNKVFL